MPKDLQPARDRRLDAVKMHAHGMKIREIADYYAVSKEVARRLVAQGRRELIRERTNGPG